MKAISLRIRGKVQGVFYRESMRQEAARLQLEGWVRNRSDGSVEAFVQGEAEKLSEIVEWCRRGPPSAKVETVEESPADTETELHGFTRKETF